VENVPTGDPRRVSEGLWIVGEDFKSYGHSSTKRMDIIKIENECALFKYPGINHDFREGQDIAFRCRSGSRDIYMTYTLGLLSKILQLWHDRLYLNILKSVKTLVNRNLYLILKYRYTCIVSNTIERTNTKFVCCKTFRWMCFLLLLVNLNTL